MIGVIANPSDHAVVSEFFELFKTPWEFCRSGQRYEVLLCADDDQSNEHAGGFVLIYSGLKLSGDAEDSERTRNTSLLYKGIRIPIYGDSLSFVAEGEGVLVDEQSRRDVLQQFRPRGRTVIRIGYSLFAETRILLTAGQPVDQASIPTLDRHIGLLRDLIVANGIALAEIPPVPEGYKFIACLTHDVDHPSIRVHKFDHTILGFFYRAIIGSLIDVLKARAPFGKLAKNWGAALRLPFVHLGLAKDFWLEFDAYAKLEQGARSTFFLIPFKGRAGRQKTGPAPGLRACGYSLTDIANPVRRLLASGCEIGTHGIDAWVDSSSGREELEQIRQISRESEIGIRMHWLYFDEHSPATLETAGASYDSTIGYNQTIGYRAGTSQSYRPLEAKKLLELPLHIMDTALFYPSHLNLSSRVAHERVSSIVNHAVESGGSVTVNWHDRSIFPERLWGEFYLEMIGELKDKGAWFATAGQAVAWFRMRRAATFENVGEGFDASQAKIAGGKDGVLPGLQLKIHPAQPAREVHRTGAILSQG